MNPIVITLDAEGGRIAAAIAARMNGVREVRAGRDGELRELFVRAFASERAIVCVMAAGIVQRLAAPLLSGKLEDPALVAIDKAARYAISLLSGHEGGANLLAYEVARATGAEPVITTGSETERRFVLGLGCRRGVGAEELRRALLGFLAEEGLALSDIRLAATLAAKRDEDGLLAVCAELDLPLRFFEAEELAAEAARQAVSGAPLSPSAAARHGELGTPAVAEPSALLASRRGRLKIPKRDYGCAAFALAEEDAWAPPAGAPPAGAPPAGAPPAGAPPAGAPPAGVGAGMQAPVNSVPASVGATIGSRRGRLSIIGLGPGSLEYLAPAARRALLRADFVAGYGPYLELAAPLLKCVETYSTPMREEGDRARRAIEEALRGRRAALVASGDACVYGIGGLALALASEEELGAFDLEIHPGITAANAAAALVGSPLEDDYAVISLSDLVAPRDRILARLSAAAGGGFALALYNPRSGLRRELFREAVARILETRSPETPAAVVRAATREGERRLVCPLGELLCHEEEIDMSSVVLVASSEARIKAGLIVQPRGRGA